MEKILWNNHNLILNKCVYDETSRYSTLDCTNIILDSQKMALWLSSMYVQYFPILIEEWHFLLTWTSQRMQNRTFSLPILNYTWTQIEDILRFISPLQRLVQIASNCYPEVTEEKHFFLQRISHQCSYFFQNCFPDCLCSPYSPLYHRIA